MSVEQLGIVLSLPDSLPLNINHLLKHLRFVPKAKGGQRERREEKGRKGEERKREEKLKAQASALAVSPRQVLNRKWEISVPSQALGDSVYLPIKSRDETKLS